MCVGCALDRALINYGLHNVDILWMPEGDLRLQKVRFKTAQASLYPTPRPYTQYPHRASDHQRWIRVESALNPIARMGGRVGGGRVAGRTGGGRAGHWVPGRGRAGGWVAGRVAASGHSPAAFSDVFSKTPVGVGCALDVR